MRPISVVFLVLVLGVSACGNGDGDSSSSDEYEGTYQVTARTLNPTACDAEGPASALEPPFFQLSQEAASTGKALVYYKCTTADSCQTDVLTTAWYFDGKGEGKWSGVATAAMSPRSDGKCFLSLTANEATLTGPDLRMEKRTSTGEVDPPAGTTCEGATAGSGQIVTFAIEHKAELTCKSLETVTAKKI